MVVQILGHIHIVLIFEIYNFYFHDVPMEKNDGITPFLNDKSRNFKYIYILYSMVDLFHALVILFKIFQ